VTAFVILNNRSGVHGVAGTTLHTVEAWCTTHFRRDALQFAQVLTARFNGGLLVLRLISADRLLVRARIYQAGIHVATVALRFDPRLRQAHISWFVVVMAGRGSTAGKHLLQNMLLIQRDCGIRRITLQAALSHGGYVWAAHGFLPGTNAKWLVLAKRLAAKFAALSANFAPAEAAAVERLLQAQDRLALRAVTAITARHGSTTLGKYLLMGERWEGELDLSDEPSALIYFRRIGLIA
jgi:hypothetical protein